MMGSREEYYQALLDRNSEYDGIFYVAVKTTGVFCRPTCPARNPKLENCEFFETAQQALDAGFRPCKRCRPLSHPEQTPEIVQTLIEAVDAHPEKKWRSEDVRDLYIDPSTARRQFKKRFGMTFVEYARSRRMDLAVRQIGAGASVIDAQLASGYESSSGFRQAFSRILGAAPTQVDQSQVLKAAWLDTWLGPMIAIADDERLYLLEFTDRPELEQEIEGLRRKTKAVILPGCTTPITTIEAELNRYFAGELTTFKTPVACLGTAFQKQVWAELEKIPFGETRTYSDLAAVLGKPSAVRAVGHANGANPLAIIVPCHRVIRTNGDLAGYGGGLTRKRWLIDHERQIGCPGG